MCASSRIPHRLPPRFSETAAWCTARAVTRSLRFSPEVARNGGVKRPDYLWETTLGDLFCECKQAGEFEDNFRRRTAIIVSFIDREIQAAGVTGLRFDFCVDRTSGAEQSIKELIALARSNADPGQSFRYREVALKISSSDEERSGAEGAMLTSAVSVNTSPVPLGPRTASSTVEFSWCLILGSSREAVN